MEQGFWIVQAGTDDTDNGPPPVLGASVTCNPTTKNGVLWAGEGPERGVDKLLTATKTEFIIW